MKQLTRVADLKDSQTLKDCSKDYQKAKVSQ